MAGTREAVMEHHPLHDPAVKPALRRIACGLYTNRAGNAQQLSRTKLIDLARAVCDELGWTYDLAGVDDEEASP